jgi:hypothetical protein
MSKSLDVCYESAWRNGVPRHNLHVWTFAKLRDMPLMELRPVEFWANRGVGFWTWKPYIIEREMYGLTNGDILIYSDAGVEFIAPVSHIIDRMDQDIFLFGNNWEHAHWCKRDIAEAVWPLQSRTLGPSPTGWEAFGKQAQASIIFFRVSDYSRKFVAEWLKWCLHRVRFSKGVCTDEWRYLIDDSPSIAPNHPEFRENRHDQAILTTLAYREGIKLHYWPASYNDGAFSYEKMPEYTSDDYPILFNHHRKRDTEWLAA